MAPHLAVVGIRVRSEGWVVMQTVAHVGIQPWKLGPRLAGALSRSMLGGITAISETSDGPAWAQRALRVPEQEGLQGSVNGAPGVTPEAPCRAPSHVPQDVSGEQASLRSCVSCWRGLGTVGLFQRGPDRVRLSGSAAGTSFPFSFYPRAGARTP